MKRGQEAGPRPTSHKYSHTASLLAFLAEVNRDSATPFGEHLCGLGAIATFLQVFRLYL